MTQPSFNASVSALIDKARCRMAVTPEERDEAFRLRYRAYAREGALPAGAPNPFRDRFDDEPNARTFTMHVDGRLAGSMRIHVVDAARPEHPALYVYPECVLPAIEAGRVLVDPTRFVVDEEMSRAHPKLAHAGVRIAWMAAAFFGADILLATVRKEHQAFYARLLGYREVCPPRHYPSLTKPLSLMSLAFKAQRLSVEERRPFLASTREEREALFSGFLPSRTSEGHVLAEAD